MRTFIEDFTPANFNPHLKKLLLDTLVQPRLQGFFRRATGAVDLQKELRITAGSGFYTDTVGRVYTQISQSAVMKRDGVNGAVRIKISAFSAFYTKSDKFTLRFSFIDSTVLGGKNVEVYKGLGLPTVLVPNDLHNILDSSQFRLDYDSIEKRFAEVAQEAEDIINSYSKYC